MEHPQKVLEDAVAMYASRVSVALEERKLHQHVGMFVMMDGATRVEPDMRVLCLDRQQLLERVDQRHPSVPGALALMDALHEAVPIGVVFNDGGVMVTLVEVHDADRDRR